MRPETAKLLSDAANACDLLIGFSAGKAYVDYVADPLLQSAVERQFITIGEALKQASKIESDLDRSLTSFRKIIGFRNILVHGYAMVHHPTVWGVVETELAVLKAEIDALLATDPAA